MTNNSVGFEETSYIKCKKCRAPAIIYQRYSGMHLCENHFCEDVERKVKLTIRQTYKINKNDVIAVALSGGKDSSVALYIINKIFERRPDIKIVAITIDEGIEGYRNLSIKRTKEFTKKYGIEHKIYSFKDEYETTMDYIVKENNIFENYKNHKNHKNNDKKEPGACSYCGVLRKKLLNKAARELGATKLVIGHNLDDEAQTIMLNYFKGDVARMLQTSSTEENEHFVLRVKPLRKISEREVALYAYIHDMPMELTRCPHSFGALRKEVRNMLNDYEIKHPGTKYSLLKGFDTIVPIIRKTKDEIFVTKISFCEKCGDPTSGKYCQACKMLENLKIK
ncbi:MAG: TIGR00269 family protein [Methanosarcinaceae archaeon]|nr:TIGR00269 family protein [Methanosarcinaceae archaeon]